MNLNWGSLKFQLGNRFREKIQNNPNVTQICLKLSIDFKFGMTCT